MPWHPRVPHDTWIPPAHSNGDPVASYRCDNDDYDDYKDASNRIVDEPHMTLDCSSIQIQTPLPISPKKQKSPPLIPPNKLPPLAKRMAPPRPCPGSHT